MLCRALGAYIRGEVGAGNISWASVCVSQHRDTENVAERRGVKAEKPLGSQHGGPGRRRSGRGVEGKEAHKDPLKDDSLALGMKTNSP